MKQNKTLVERLWKPLLFFGIHLPGCNYLPWALDNLMYASRPLRRLMANELCRQHGCKTREEGPWARRPYGPVDVTERELVEIVKRERENNESSQGRHYRLAGSCTHALTICARCRRKCGCEEKCAA